jgi:glycosyltransferase involved in cell wall biosynthesis
LEKLICFTGLVVDKELDGIYRSSKIFVFPSVYEGFGMPPLEAASRGIPVVCSRSSSVPEVMGDAVYYFDPKDPETLARALDKVGGSHKIKDELIRRGLKRSKHFSWERTATQTSVLYESW